MLARAIPDVEVRGLDAFENPPEIAETADTFQGNAGLKARGIASWLAQQGEPGDTVVLADDSGICVDALGGAPGVHSARFAGEQADDAANNARLVQELRARGRSSSSAHYSCALALVRVDAAPMGPDADAQGVHYFEGRWSVQVRTDARGTGGFGYDPHAWVGPNHTVAELSAAQKAAKSHRGEALRHLLAWIERRA